METANPRDREVTRVWLVRESTTSLKEQRVAFALDLDHHVLELLERTDFDGNGSRLGFEDGLLASEWIDTLTLFRCWLLHGSDLEKAGEDELTHRTFLDVQLDDVRKAIEHSGDLTAAELGFLSDGVEDLRLGVFVFNGRWFLGHDVV